jgi:hypothetical protein
MDVNGTKINELSPLPPPPSPLPQLPQSKNTSSPITASHPAATFVSALTNYSNTLSSSCTRPSTILDYYTLSKDYSTIASSLVNSDSTATIVSINYVCDLKSDYVLNMRDFVNGEISWGENYEDLEKQFGEEVDAGITGVELFQYDILDGVEEVREGNGKLRFQHGVCN